MLHLDHFGYASEAECLELVTLFASVEEPEMRTKILNLMKALALNDGVTLDQAAMS
jgi:hypothetical protein